VAERSEPERIVVARTSTQQAAHGAELILRVADGQTDAAIAQDVGLAERTVWLCCLASLSLHSTALRQYTQIWMRFRYYGATLLPTSGN
jgi:hypothetical protein